MSELRLETWSMPAADLGPENPLPPLRPFRELHAVESAPGIPEAMLANMAYGHVPNTLPYAMQDGYARALQERAFRVAVLENETLRATFLLEFGGRLWSLVHKPSGRELLSVNPVLQLANLAIRNAWFCGGVEWNIGTIGHSPFTCAPLFAARVAGAEGAPVLRLYEWERIRQTPFQIDAFLPDGSPVLFVRVQISNPHPHETPMYWWSNIAVPESPDTRVVAPADAAYRFGYKRTGLMLIPVPEFEGVDFTYTTNVDHAADFFFHIPDDARHWIAALDGAGRGLVQVSTRRLVGRKLFLWGTGPGGRKWQQFLAPTAAQGYLEIQAGLARTQMEHLAMPSGATWSWLEAYGLLEADADAVHGGRWADARAAVSDALERLIPRARLDAVYERSARFADAPPDAVLQRGSGWGALERVRRAHDGEAPFCAGGLVFDDESMGAAQAPWLSLLRDGTFPVTEPETPPRGFMVQAAWRGRMERAVAGRARDNWLAWLHLGVMRHYAGDWEAAQRAWERSLACAPTPWALRNLAVLAAEAGRRDEAADRMAAACRLAPGLAPLAVECGRALIDAGRPGAWLELCADLPPPVRALGRIRLLEAEAALAAGDLARTARALHDEGLVVADLREGEIALSDLWFEYHAQRISQEEGVPVDDALRARARREYPLPDHLEFRMSGAT